MGPGLVSEALVATQSCAHIESEEQTTGGQQDLGKSAGSQTAWTARARMQSCASLQSRLHSFYLRHNPEKVDDAPKVSRLFAGKEEELNEKLRARYDGADLSTLDLNDR